MFINFILDILSTIYSKFDISWVTAAIAMGGLVIAYRGLSEWKGQLRGRTEYSVARDYLKALIRLRTAIEGVRDPVVGYSEQKKH